MQNPILMLFTFGCLGIFNSKMAVRRHLKRSTLKLINITMECCTLSLLLEFLGIQNSILCGVIFVFYCTRIFNSKMASGRHLKGHLESIFIGFLVCRILSWCNFAL